MYSNRLNHTVTYAFLCCINNIIEIVVIIDTVSNVYKSFSCVLMLIFHSESQLGFS